MKLTISFRLLVSAFMFAATITPSIACGPFPPIIPTPDFFKISGPHKTMADYEREENLRLWQSLTSDDIPLRDIEDAVYCDSREKFDNYTGYMPAKSRNLFYVYLNNSDDYEIMSFLSMAKELEEKWDGYRSPWYYPKERNYTSCTGDFDEIIEQCKEQSCKRLNDRYALQATRALFASRRYAECVEFADSAFADIPDSNLMKRMAQRYMAGSLSRLGDTARADSIFAISGDIWSITASDKVEFMAKLNPNAPQLIDYIRNHATDSAFMRDMAKIAEKLLKDCRVRNNGDWNFLLAYTANKFDSRPAIARNYIYKALNGKFSTSDLADLARAYKIKLDASTGCRSLLLADLRWMESKTKLTEPDAKEWIRRAQNIIYVDMIPSLWQARDYSTAIQLAAYADNLESANLRLSKKDIDYGSLTFQLMGSLSSSQLALAYNKIMESTPLNAYLRKWVRTESDFYNEVIGTLALREENYDRAIRYLSTVNEAYIRNMNIDKDGYLARDPFAAYHTRWSEYSYSGNDGETWEYETQAAFHRGESDPGAKLDFARKMNAYKRTMLYGRTADERGMARLMYAIGRRNSFEECWALTQYWRGYVGKFEVALQYWDDKFARDHYSFLYDYDDHKATEALFEKEKAAALAMLTTDDARARAEYVLGNLAKIVKLYADTPTAKYVRTSCDNWRSWL